jgi:hypothetical protein
MKRSTLVLAPIAALAAVALTGCSAVTDFLYKESETHYDDASALVDDWGKADTVGWLPSDATDIDIRESTEGSPAVMRFTSASGLALSQCAETERRSIPVFVDDWTPNDDDLIKLTTVFACGDWAVADIEGHLFGWTPSAPDEQPAAPQT